MSGIVEIIETHTSYYFFPTQFKHLMNVTYQCVNQQQVKKAMQLLPARKLSITAIASTSIDWVIQWEDLCASYTTT